MDKIKDRCLDLIDIHVLVITFVISLLSGAILASEGRVLDLVQVAISAMAVSSVSFFMAGLFLQWHISKWGHVPSCVIVNWPLNVIVCAIVLFSTNLVAQIAQRLL